MKGDQISGLYYSYSQVKLWIAKALQFQLERLLESFLRASHNSLFLLKSNKDNILPLNVSTQCFTKYQHWILFSGMLLSSRPLLMYPFYTLMTIRNEWLWVVWTSQFAQTSLCISRICWKLTELFCTVEVAPLTALL